MPYQIPPYIAAARVDSPTIRYVWDDWRASEDFQTSADTVIERVKHACVRSQVAIVIGMYEWTLGRFRTLSDDPTPFQIAEAAWCGNIDRRYMEYWEFDRKRWIGPIRGPLWCAMTWLIPAVLAGEDEPEELESGVSYLYRLAMHILPAQHHFVDWLEPTLSRMTELFPAGPEDPLEDLFKEREEERRGLLIPREALDPSVPFESSMTNALIDQFLRGVDYRTNPFLKDPAKLQKEGFQGIPYELSTRRSA
jgi:hypothetical protein